ncbi:MAG: trypsin-like peptidase domain-containing protein [Anaerolineales bacterium]
MKTNMRLFLPVMILILASMACQAVSLPFGNAPSSSGFQPAAPTNIPALVSSANLSEQENVLTSLYAHVTPGIVAIQVLTATGADLGTGFVYNDQGYIITNQHVVDGQTKMEVDFPDGYKAFAKMIGVDPDSDLAVIKVDAPASEIHPLTLGDSSKLKVGQTVIAIGNPFGLNGTMTTGIISALGRTLPSNHATTSGSTFSTSDQIQTDAAINPGNSGGPLLNLNGEVIGINRAIRTDSSATSGEPVNSGIGFAIAINIVKRVAPVIIKSGKYDYPYMGMGSQDQLTLDEINTLGLKRLTGAYVANVVPGGPADKAGVIGGTKDVGLENLKGGGDLIIAVDGQAVNTFSDFLSYLVNNKSPGDVVTLTVLRGDQKLDIKVTLDKRP